MAWETSTRRQRLPKDWPTRRRRVLRRDPTCQLRFDCCTKVSTEVDHKNRGDDHRMENLQGVCGPCHKRKTAGEAAEARAQNPPPSRRRPTEEHPGFLHNHAGVGDAPGTRGAKTEGG